jgi:hypothetical protein
MCHTYLNTTLGSVVHLKTDDYCKDRECKLDDPPQIYETELICWKTKNMKKTPANNKIISQWIYCRLRFKNISFWQNGDLKKIKKMTSNEVYLTFKDVIDDRNAKGLRVEASFGGVRDIRIKDVKLNKRSLEASITMVFRCDISYSIEDKNDKLLEGGSDNVKKQKDVWTFARKLNSDIPNWYLIKTE